MKLALAAGLLASGAVHAASGGDNRNPLFHATHMQPSPYTQRAGDVMIGTEASIGLTDFLEVGTSLIRDFYKIFNAYAKVKIYDDAQYAIAAGLSFETYNLNNISDANPDFRVNTWAPSIIGAYALRSNLALISSFRFLLSNNLRGSTAYQTSGFQRGVAFGTDVSWGYNSSGTGNALAAGVTYDFTTTTLGFGVSHIWPGFQLGIHYYPNADLYKVHPIIAGGMALDL